MARVLALFVALVLLFQTSWAVAATYCEHETPSNAAMHFGHHAHDHQAADGQEQPAGKLAVDDDCAFCHAGHPAIVPATFACVAPEASSVTASSPCTLGASTPPGKPERPQWPRLA